MELISDAIVSASPLFIAAENVELFCAGVINGRKTMSTMIDKYFILKFFVHKFLGSFSYHLAVFEIILFNVKMI